jgi:hypothetical protein
LHPKCEKELKAKEIVHYPNYQKNFVIFFIYQIFQFIYSNYSKAKMKTCIEEKLIDKDKKIGFPNDKFL